MRLLLGVLTFPLSLLYGIVVWFRNALFNCGILKQKEFSIPVICVGNITVGGTGKTPLVDYVVGLLKKKYELAVISRGYKRKTRGFQLAGHDSTVDQIGDEAFLHYKKHGEKIKVAVDGNRVRGIHSLTRQFSSLKAVVMDDGFQHRYVKPGMNILLVDYTRPMFKDFLLPYGRLRESKLEKYRANVIVVTKVPHDIKPIDIRIFKKKLKPKPYQYVFFSSIQYDDFLHPVFSKKNIEIPPIKEFVKENLSCILLTGIANPAPMVQQIKKLGMQVKKHMKLADHQNISSKHINKLSVCCQENKDSFILTTEKDAVRLQSVENLIPEEIKEKTYYYPIKVSFLKANGKSFDNLLSGYIEKGVFPSKLSR